MIVLWKRFLFWLSFGLGLSRWMSLVARAFAGRDLGDLPIYTSVVDVSAFMSTVMYENKLNIFQIAAHPARTYKRYKKNRRINSASAAALAHQMMKDVCVHNPQENIFAFNLLAIGWYNRKNMGDSGVLWLALTEYMEGPTVSFVQDDNMLMAVNGRIRLGTNSSWYVGQFQPGYIDIHEIVKDVVFPKRPFVDSICIGWALFDGNLRLTQFSSGKDVMHGLG